MPPPSDVLRVDLDTEHGRMPVWHRPGDGTHAVILLHGACSDHGTFDSTLSAFAVCGSAMPTS